MRSSIADRAEADEARRRAIELAGDEKVGIPPDGAAYVLLRDPLFHGRAVLERKCLGCHYYDGKGEPGSRSAADLKDFGSRGWIRGLLENPQAAAYFGKVPQCDGMAEWKRNSKLSPKQLDDVADFVATFAKIAPGTTPRNGSKTRRSPNIRDWNPSRRNAPRAISSEGLSEAEAGMRDAPKLFAWGSPQWIARMIHKPGAPDLYGYLEKKDQMPSFADQLTANDTETLIRYLRNDYPGATFPSEAPPKTAVAKAGSARHRPGCRRPWPLA